MHRERASILVLSLAAVVAEAVPVSPDFVTIRGDQFIHRGQVIKLKGTNYYPRDHMWAALWDGWDPKAIQQEITMIRGLGMNSVRILVPYSNGGWRDKKTGQPPLDRIRMLHTLIDSFGRQGIRSCVTLFDWETSFPTEATDKEAEHLRYVKAIVTPLKGNPYVLMWDVKNEPDHPDNLGDKLDDWEKSKHQEKIVSWLRRMCEAVKANDPNHPVTVGLRWAANVDECLPFEDIATFHSYWPNIGTEQIPSVKKATGRRVLPIVVQEFGWPSHPNPCDREGRIIRDYSEDNQLAFYKKHLEAFLEHDIAGCIQWMTFDAKEYRENPKESFEQYFGLWRYDQALKPAGEFYRDTMKVRLFPPATATRPAAAP